MTVSLHGLGEFLAYLPHQFGFVPARSIILVGMRRGRVCGLVRLDEELTEWDIATEARRACPSLARMMSHGEPDSVIVVFYRLDCDGIGPLDDKQAVLRWAAEEFVPVQHALVVAGDVWWAIECSSGCCDGALHPVPDLDPDVVMRSVGRVQTPAASRETALEHLTGCDPVRAKVVGEATRVNRGLTAGQAEDAWRSLISSAPPSDVLLGRALSGLENSAFREAFLWFLVPELTRGMPSVWERGDADRAAAVLEGELVAVPHEFRGTWLAFLGLARWRRGDHTGAGLAAEQALRDCPEDELASTVAAIVLHGMPYVASLPDRLPGSEPWTAAQDVDDWTPRCGGVGQGFVP